METCQFRLEKKNSNFAYFINLLPNADFISFQLSFNLPLLLAPSLKKESVFKTPSFLLLEQPIILLVFILPKTVTNKFKK